MDKEKHTDRKTGRQSNIRTCRAATFQQKTSTITRLFSFKEDNFTRVCYHVYYIGMELSEIQPYSHIRECLRLQEIIRPIPTSQSPEYLQTFCVSIPVLYRPISGPIGNGLHRKGNPYIGVVRYVCSWPSKSFTVHILRK